MKESKMQGKENVGKENVLKRTCGERKMREEKIQGKKTQPWYSDALVKTIIYFLCYYLTSVL